MREENSIGDSKQLHTIPVFLRHRLVKLNGLVVGKAGTLMNQWNLLLEVTIEREGFANWAVVVPEQNCRVGPLNQIAIELCGLANASDLRLGLARIADIAEEHKMCRGGFVLNDCPHPINALVTIWDYEHQITVNLPRRRHEKGENRKIGVRVKEKLKYSRDCGHKTISCHQNSRDAWRPIS